MSNDIPAASGIVTLMTDFGESDGYAGSMKGVILKLAPDVRIIDISHILPPFNITSAAYALFTCYCDFPAGSVHIAVVDPGVGSQRRPVTVAYQDYFFVGPDNGLFSLILAQGGDYRAWEIKNVAPTRGRISRTFHGRDIFAPAAAHLASNRDPGQLGPECMDLMMLPQAAPQTQGKRVLGEVIHIDHFGNLITNIREDMLDRSNPGAALIKIGSCTIMGLSETFSDREPGELLAYVGSAGLLEIGIVQGSAAAAVKTPLGREVTFTARGRNPE